MTAGRPGVRAFVEEWLEERKFRSDKEDVDRFVIGILLADEYLNWTPRPPREPLPTLRLSAQAIEKIMKAHNPLPIPGFESLGIPDQPNIVYQYSHSGDRVPGDLADMEAQADLPFLGIPATRSVDEEWLTQVRWVDTDGSGKRRRVQVWSAEQCAAEAST